MTYHILCKGIRIASFEYESDRDVCLVAFEECYSDCEFDTEDEDE